MHELLFLGTGAGIPSSARNTSSLALSFLGKGGGMWLFDCGEATQHQILHTKIRPGKIKKIFISHLHGDHIFGLPGLLSSRSFLGGRDCVDIYGPVGLKKYIEVSLAVSSTQLKYNLFIHEITEGTIYDDDELSVTAVLLEHGIPSYGYRIREKDKIGALNAEKLKQLGIPPGPIYGEIKRREKVVLPNGEEILRGDYTLEEKKGRVIAIAGDTLMCGASKKLAEDADWLVHEATFDFIHRKKAHAYFHTTNVEAFAIAMECNVKNLILTHISPRYSSHDYESFLGETKKEKINVYVAEDYAIFEI